MIFLRLSGGLGNQLYQLAAASILSEGPRSKHKVVPLIEGLSRYEEARSPDSLALLQPNCWLFPAPGSMSKMWRWLTLNGRAGRWLPAYGISDRNIWKTVINDAQSYRIMDGYFQHGWTHEAFSRAIQSMPVRPISSLATSRIGKDEVAVHIRGGDFLRLPRFQVVNADFYVHAAQLAIERGFRDFAIMTDDQAYAETIVAQMHRDLPQAMIKIMPRAASALEDFDTLRAATARIIGNSTFAWWAAALGNAPALTWSPTKFTNNEFRDFYLPFEIPLESPSFAKKSTYE